MKILLVRANPRKVGYTERMANLFAQGVREAGGELKDVDLTSLSVTRCDGCFHCWVATPGQCVHSDDMGPLLEELIGSDVLACATPLYFYSMASALKSFFERLLPLSVPDPQPSRLGLTQNQIRYPERWGQKTLISIVVGAFREPEAYRPAYDTFKLIADSIQMDFGGQLTRPESSLQDYRLSKPKTLRLIEAAFVEAGREAATRGRLSQNITEAAAAPLAASVDHFRTYSGFYWETAQRLGPTALDPSEVRKTVAGDVRILMREMVRCLDPVATARVKLTLQFEFTDLQKTYEVQIDHGHCTLLEHGNGAADLKVQCKSTTWAGLFTRQVNPRAAVLAGEIKLDGDRSLFVRLERFFPPPSM